MRLRKVKRVAISDKEEKLKKKPFFPRDIVNQLIADPNLSVQVITIALTLFSDNVRMERRIDSMATSLDKMRSITQVITNTMNSLKSAAQAPRRNN